MKPLIVLMSLTFLGSASGQPLTLHVVNGSSGLVDVLLGDHLEQAGLQPEQVVNLLVQSKSFNVLKLTEAGHPERILGQYQYTGMGPGVSALLVVLTGKNPFHLSEFMVPNLDQLKHPHMALVSFFNLAQNVGNLSFVAPALKNVTVKSALPYNTGGIRHLPEMAFDLKVTSSQHPGLSATQHLDLKAETRVTLVVLGDARHLVMLPVLEP